jgi:hypothetical protein
MKKTKYPDCYLHVRDEKSGEEWIEEIGEERLLDLKQLVERWIYDCFGGELKLDGELMPKLSGDYYAKIKTDGRAPDSAVCWDSGGFYLQATN